MTVQGWSDPFEGFKLGVRERLRQVKGSLLHLNQVSVISRFAAHISGLCSVNLS